ncbi:MAG: hypothetical protein H7Y12_13990 [Sphingobacteriaceae bacterium]|nr:hypothetical protein [Cytophagaceae bacterium]
MHQLFQNLLTNSLKFSRVNVPPEIRISSRMTTKSEKTDFALNPQRAYVQLTIADNGIGFEPEYAEKIFEIFKRLHGRSEYEGTGIGLSIVKRIVENHDGYVYAEGWPGAGAIFIVMLPMGK